MDPKAFLDMNDYRLEFESTNNVDGRLSEKVNFIKKEDNV